MVSWVAQWTGSDSPYMSAAAIPVAISLFHTIFNISNTFLLVWFVKPIAKLVERFVPEKLLPEKEIDEPKYLNKEVLKYPETLIVSLEKESKYLFKNAVFEIVAHSLNIHRADIKSDEKMKDILKRSTEDMGTDVEDLYHTKVKKIYGEIIRYASLAQSNFKLTQAQNKHVSEIKIANRKMVEILRNMKELSPNVTLYIESDNEYVRKEYNKLRKKIARVLRIIYRFRTKKDRDVYHEKLMKLKNEAREEIHSMSDSIERLIREGLITVDMGSSLVNDRDNVNDTIKKLITIADLLYGEQDPLLEQENK
jgi:phosphate:Na+ symporter